MLSHRFTIAFIASGLSLALPAERPHSEMVHGTRAQSSFPFQAAGVYWRDPSTATIRARASADGRKWTQWIESHGERIEDGRMVSGLIYVGEGHRYIEVEGVADPEVLLIDPGLAPIGTTEKRQSSRAADISAPPIITREQWGCTPQTCPAKDPPLYTTVTHLIVHHTDNLNTATDWAAVIRAIWVLHVQGNGWNDIGYNYLVDPNGLLYEGRAGGDGVLGAHFSSVNSGTMGVALLGTFIDVTPPAPMLDTLENMLAWQANKWKLDPSGETAHAASGLMLNVISGHRDAGISPKASGTTECPGNTAYSLLPRVRTDVLTRMAACVVGIGERNRCVQSEGGSLSFSILLRASANCTSPVAITPAADWVALGNVPFSIALNVMPNPGPRRTTTVDIGGLNLNITQAGKDEGALPCIGMRGIVNGANFDPRPVVAGSQVSIFGENFGDAAKAAVNGKPVAIEYAGPTQINVTLPPSVNIGTNHLTVTNETTGPEVNFWVTEAMPAIFASADGRAIAVNVDDNTLNAADTPVKAGRPLTVYLTGVGAVGNTALHDAVYSWTVTVGGKPAGKLFLGLAPLFVAVYQANLVIPTDLSPGDYPLTFTVNGVASREATISVGN